MEREERLKEIVQAFKNDAKRESSENKQRPKERATKRKPIKEITTKKNYGGEASPHWDFLNSRQRYTDEGNPIEDVLANPDSLSEEDSLYSRSLSEAGEEQLQIIRKVMAKLPPQQQRALYLCGELNYTLENAAREMNVTVRTVRSALDRARAKIKRLYDSQSSKD